MFLIFALEAPNHFISAATKSQTSILLISTSQKFNIIQLSQLVLKNIYYNFPRIYDTVFYNVLLGSWLGHKQQARWMARVSSGLGNRIQVGHRCVSRGKGVKGIRPSGSWT
jgi:hypothetical protein